MKKTKRLEKNIPATAPVIVNLNATELEKFKAWVEEFTGGPNKCQVPYGGVCIRPDIILHQNCCNACEYHQFCLCRSCKIS
jgi:hypothetical protein|tara:strand:+ start:4219 stop:4461 length:243 start_codon:yes stop_codon:yes gene_type:complete